MPILGRLKSLLLVVAFLWLIPACGVQRTTTIPPMPTVESNTDKSADANGVNLVVGDKSTYTALLESHRGKVILVDFWATWCGPCVEQFPHSIALAKKHADQGLIVISVSMNEPSEQAAVLSFLTKQQATIDNLLTSYGAGSEFVDAFELRGDIPFYRLYDRSGQLHCSFSDDPAGIENCQLTEKIDQVIEQLLAE